jgi:hypothetical protein
MENLNIKGMMVNRLLSKAIGNVGCTRSNANWNTKPGHGCEWVQVEKMGADEQDVLL